MNKIVTITYLNEVKCFFSGIAPDHLKQTMEHFSEFQPNYFFSPQFKLGRWNGKKAFFTEGGQTFINLVPDVLKFLKKFGYENFVTKDKRKEYTFYFPNIDKNYLSNTNIILEDHQVECINALLSNYGGVLRAGTGAGKTFITAVLCDVFNKNNLRVMVIVPKADLVNQTISEFGVCGIDAGEYSGSNKDIEHLNVISTWQALQNNTLILKMFDVVIHDECQNSGGLKIVSILSEDCNHMPIRIGLTGTIPDDPYERMMLKCNIGEIVYEVSSKQLQDKGWLADIHINCINLKEDFKLQYKQWCKNNPETEVTYNEYFNGYFADYASEMGYATKSDNRNTSIIELVKAAMEDTGNVLIVLNSVKHGKILESLLPGSVFVYGSTKRKERDKTYASYSDADNIIMISTYKLVQEGLNIKRIKNLFLVDSGKSFKRVVQTLGRGLRKGEGKDHVEVYDIHSNFKYSIKHLKERIKYYKREEFPFTKYTIQLPPAQKVEIDEELRKSVDFD